MGGLWAATLRPQSAKTGKYTVTIYIYYIYYCNPVYITVKYGLGGPLGGKV